jgi:hypothetical protein
MKKYAEIERKNNEVVAFGEAPFIPNFGTDSARYCVDVTDTSLTLGDIYDPITNTFSPPPDPEAAYIGTLILQNVTGGDFNETTTELNAYINSQIVVNGEITDKTGAVLPLDIPLLRLPILPTDLDGNTLANAQPSLAVASIANGAVTAQWTPEYTGTFAITEQAINVRLPDGAKLHFECLEIFVLPNGS